MKPFTKLRELLEKSTPGKWYYYGNNVGWNGIVIGIHPDKAATITGKGEPFDGDDDFDYNIIGVKYEYFEAKEEDCILISESRNQLPAMLEALDLAIEIIKQNANGTFNVKANKNVLDRIYELSK